jgi:hypothetical protein
MIEYGKARVGTRAEVKSLTNTGEDAPHLAHPRPQGEPLTFRDFYVIIRAAMLRLPGRRLVQRSLIYAGDQGVELVAKIASEDDLAAFLMAAAPSPSVARTTASKIWIQFEMARQSVAELRQEGSHD